MNAVLFYGIALPSYYYEKWLDPKDFQLEPAIAEERKKEHDEEEREHGRSDINYEIDEEALDVAVNDIGEALYGLWNSYEFGNKLASTNDLAACCMGQCNTNEDDDDMIFVAVTRSMVSTSNIEHLGTMTPDPAEWKNAVDKAIVLIETELEQKVGHRIIIPTKNEIQWHLALRETNK